jgi:hypothetical protein
MTVASKASVPASWASSDWGLLGSPLRIVVVEHHPARRRQRVERRIRAGNQMLINRSADVTNTDGRANVVSLATISY